MTNNVAKNARPTPSSASSETPNSNCAFSGYSRLGSAQITRGGKRYLGTGRVQLCGEDRRPLADPQAHETPGYRPNKITDKVITCWGTKDNRWYRFTGTLTPFVPKSKPIVTPTPVEVPEPELQALIEKAPRSRREKRPIRENHARELQRIRQSLNAALDPDVRMEFITEYLNESRANIYRKMGMTPPQFPAGMKRGHGRFWPFSLVEAYKNNTWKP